MELLKKVNVLVLALVVLLAAGCGKDEPEPEGTNCKLIKYVTTYTIGELLYNSAGKVYRVNYINRPDQALIYHVEIDYNSNGNISRALVFDSNNSFVEKSVFTYNAAQLPDTITTYDSVGTLANFNINEYNAAGQLVKSSILEPQDTVTSSFQDITYPTVDQAKVMNYRRDASGNVVLYSTVEYKFDDKKRPDSALNYLYPDMLISQHNATLVAITNYPSGPNPINSYTYSYNAGGYPIQSVITDNNQQTLTIDYTYSCQ